MMRKKAPPLLASRISERMLDSRVQYAALGDFEERYIIQPGGFSAV